MTRNLFVMGCFGSQGRKKGLEIILFMYIGDCVNNRIDGDAQKDHYSTHYPVGHFPNRYLLFRVCPRQIFHYIYFRPMGRDLGVFLWLSGFSGA